VHVVGVPSSWDLQHGDTHSHAYNGTVGCAGSTAAWHKAEGCRCALQEVLLPDEAHEPQPTRLPVVAPLCYMEPPLLHPPPPQISTPPHTHTHTWVVLPWWLVKVTCQQLPLHGASSEVAAVKAVGVKAEAAASEVVACTQRRRAAMGGVTTASAASAVAPAPGVLPPQALLVGHGRQVELLHSYHEPRTNPYP
jgi:hypothetical protein